MPRYCLCPFYLATVFKLGNVAAGILSIVDAVVEGVIFAGIKFDTITRAVQTCSSLLFRRAGCGVWRQLVAARVGSLLLVNPETCGCVGME